MIQQTIIYTKVITNYNKDSIIVEFQQVSLVGFLHAIQIKYSCCRLCPMSNILEFADEANEGILSLFRLKYDFSYLLIKLYQICNHFTTQSDTVTLYVDRLSDSCWGGYIRP